MSAANLFSDVGGDPHQRPHVSHEGSHLSNRILACLRIASILRRLILSLSCAATRRFQPRFVFESRRETFSPCGGIFAEAGNYDLNVINAALAANVVNEGTGLLADGGNAAGGGPYLQNGGLGTARCVADTTALIVANGGSGRRRFGTPNRGLGGNHFESGYRFLGPPVAVFEREGSKRNAPGAPANQQGVQRRCQEPSLDHSAFDRVFALR